MIFFLGNTVKEQEPRKGEKKGNTGDHIVYQVQGARVSTPWTRGPASGITQQTQHNLLRQPQNLN